MWMPTGRKNKPIIREMSYDWEYLHIDQEGSKGKKRIRAPSLLVLWIETLPSFPHYLTSVCGITRDHTSIKQSDNFVSLTHSAIRGGFMPVWLGSGLYSPFLLLQTTPKAYTVI